MKEGIIIYQSKYGATKKYVDWIVEETNFDIVETKKVILDNLKEYKVIILCGGIYASGIAGLSFLKKNNDVLKDKKLAIFCVGASPYNEKAFNELREHNLNEDLKDIPIFYGRGAWNEKIMTFRDRTLCKMLKKMVSKKDPSTFEPWMEALMSVGNEEKDWTDKKYLSELLDYIKK